MENTAAQQVVVITGASAGLGRSIAQAFGRRKARIGLIARGRAGLEAAKREIEEAGGQALVIPADVADADAMEKAAQQVEDTFGPIDIWINNAMASVFSEVKDMKPDEYKRVTEVTYLGQVYGALAALKRMLPRDRGSIVFVGSALAYRGIPLQSAYCGAKHAIQGFYDSLRTEMLHNKSKIHITMIQLPAMNTPQFGWVRSRLPNKARPMGKIFSPDFIADAIVYGATHSRREMLVGIPTVEAVIGNRIAPWMGDIVLANTGFDGQQIDIPEEPGRPDNLYHPLDDERDWGAHGTFGEHAHHGSAQYWASTHRATTALMAGAGIAAIAAGIWALKRRNRQRMESSSD